MSILSQPLLDSEKILALLQSDGSLALHLKHYEIRAEQQKMLACLIDAFNSNAIALLEAGTGTGKSLAYLIPALLVASIWQERVVISTHTISLQEQLLQKDLPLLMQALKLDLKIVLVKGMNNYVCLRKLDEFGLEKKFLPPQDQTILEHIEGWVAKEDSGTRSKAPFSIPPSIWEQVAAEHDTCNNVECSHYNRCFYVQARKQAHDAQILIVNHHLLLADLAVRADTQNHAGSALLPAYKRLIIDEAHHIEEIATDYFANRVSRLNLLKTLSKISSEKQGQTQGKLSLFKQRLQPSFANAFSYEHSQWLNRFTIDLPALRRELLQVMAEAFIQLEKFLEIHHASLAENKGENKLRLRPFHYEHESWKNDVIPQVNRLIDFLRRYALELNRLENCVQDLEMRQSESLKNVLFDIKALAKRLEAEADQMESFMITPFNTKAIRWLEMADLKGGINMTCVEAALDISQLLFQYLFKPLDTVALLSATLTTQKSFKFVRKQMGLSDEALQGRPLIEGTFDSPFNFEKQALFLIPKDIPSPHHPDFCIQADDWIWEAIQASQGNAFLLFTSYGMLKASYQALEKRLREHHFFPIKQGDESRQALLKRFVNQDRSILFGTDSFWEGVDVVGDALRLVVIAKLPFKVPSDPLIEAKSEAIKEQGREPFYELLLPQAAIKFKQGFGRLIRHRHDRGCVVCLDNRLITKSYGVFFLKTLPHCPYLVVDKANLKTTMQEFYSKTWQ